MKIQFVLLQNLDGYSFNPLRPEGLNYYDDKTESKIEIRAGGEKSDWDYGHRNLELGVTGFRDVDECMFNFVETLINDNIIQPERSPIKFPYSRGDEEVVSRNGKVAKGYSPTSDFLPKELHDLCITAGNELQQLAVRFVQLLRWIEKVSGPDKILSREDPRFRLYWRTQQDKYYSVPWPKQGPIILQMGGGITWTNENEKIISQLWKDENKREPLGHQLLREAKEVYEHSPRSALLICYSALEVGLKQHIATCAPDAGWLAMEVPTPPLSKILKNFLPRIHGDKDDFKNWNRANSEFNIIKKFGEDRNKMAHRGEESTASLPEYLRVTEDLLFAFDVLEGNSWAKSHVSRHFGEILGWKTVGRGTMRVQVLD